MDPDRWRQIDQLFDAVLDLPEAERGAFIDRECGPDQALRSELIGLLRAGASSASFLEQSALKVAAKNLGQEDLADAHLPLLNSTIGTYHIEHLLGAGGMGEVYLAHDSKLDRKVALKILPAEFVSDDERLKRFRLEARAISALNHPNIVTIFDVGNFAGVNFIATEAVEGKTLRQLVGTGLDLETILSIGTQVCEALTAAHAAGIAHRDIKPENIMMRPDGYVKILDFGLAKLSEGEPHDPATTAESLVIGTPAYMSPAQVMGHGVDERTDLWSLGVVLYELLTGRNPFKAATRDTTMGAVLSTEPQPIGSLEPSLPASLGRIVTKALAKDAALGYQTAAELRDELKRTKRELDSSASLSERDLAFKLAETSRRRSTLIWAAAVLVIGLTAGFVVWQYARRSRSADIGAASEWASARNIQVTDSTWVEAYPSLSPDGKNIVFASDSNEDRNIYLQRVGGKNPVNLTLASKQNDTMPAFSPDGKLIAFRSEREPAGIYVMEETGENVRRIADAGYHPSWSPDGKSLVVSDRVSGVHTNHTLPNSSLLAIDIATGKHRPLETHGDAIMPSWSPHGNRIAYWFIAEGRPGEIATVPAAGGAPVVVAADAATDWNPVWSPDGKYLYFASDRSGNMGFWRVPIDEQTGQAQGQPEAVPTPSRYCRHLTFSRDGNMFAYVRYESQSNLQSIAFDPRSLKTEGAVNWITRGDREIGNPDLSPNGAEFVVRHPGKTQEDLMVMDRNGENPRNLMLDNFRERVPRWSPDGKRIAFQSDRSGKYQVWTIAPDGNDLQQLTFSEKIGAIGAVYGPDGKRLAYTEIDGNRYAPFILDLTKPWSAQSPLPLPPRPDGQSVVARDWSNNGEMLLLVYLRSGGDEDGIGVFDFEAGVYRKLTDSGDSPVWLNDNRNFIFTDHLAVYLGDAQTGKVRELYRPAEFEVQHANISPDNKLIFFRYLQITGDVWAVTK
ncbi:MAG: protein kinase [Pyrinomonadaceae bacterium]